MLNNNTNTLLLVFTAFLVLLASCAGNQSDTVTYSGSEEPDIEVVEDDGYPDDLFPSDDPFVRQRILADMLYEARIAFDDNRLTSPPGNNAFDGFRSVLDFDPENAVALQGMEDIVLRYVELANAAIQVGQYDNAEDFLNRGAQIGEGNPAIVDARQQLVEARQTKRDSFALDPDLLDDRSLELMVELGEIGQYIRTEEATFLINARTDEEGRWIYRVMREAVGGYRLRGNIAIDAQPSIQVQVPRS